ncbi:U3 small nucleolar RNA-associated protein 10 [Erysiphe neolycopersici]|uniref:U3 small nucleolar RNA-associated protein 10 n=1 Tax=Erysiphe neolycopersici TaxID=212602 RepID=A0A420HWF5_9PEZI|nr:U3 small nucleolar RNA-associated protein 10 [Erysiphe neolycopersici]
MASTLAAQLSVIASNSRKTLDLKALKARHSKSLIFEPRTAASQNFETLYILCHEGFQELCLLDGRFLEFQRDLFGEQSQELDRSQITIAQNAELDKRLEAFLYLISGRLRLSPAIKAIEWLVRKFRIHESNVSITLQAFLPYHTLPIFTTLLSILPASLPEDCKYLQPYIRSLKNPPRNIIVQAAVRNSSFASALNTFILKMCELQYQSSSHIVFWAGIMTEAIASMLDRSRSGRAAVQLQNEQEVLLKILPILKQGLAMKEIPNLRMGCFMLLSVIVSKGNLDEKILIAMMEAVVFGWTVDTAMPSMVCLSFLAEHRGAKQLTKKLIKQLMKHHNFLDILTKISKQQRVDKLAYGICLTLIDRLQIGGDSDEYMVIEKIIENDLLTEAQVIIIGKNLIMIANHMVEKKNEIGTYLFTLIAKLIQVPGPVGSAIRVALIEAKIDLDDLELELQLSIQSCIKPDVSGKNKLVSSESIQSIKACEVVDKLEKLPKRIDNSVSFLTIISSQTYHKLSNAFLACVPQSENLKKFDELPILQKGMALENPLYLSFHMRVWCSTCPVSARVSALRMATLYLVEHKHEIDFQAIIPYAITALGDPSTKVRRGAVGLLNALSKIYARVSAIKTCKLWCVKSIYEDGNKNELHWLPTDVAARFVSEILIPASEECVLDKKHIESLIKPYLCSRGKEISDKNNCGRLSQSSRKCIMHFLSSQIDISPIFIVKLRLLSCVNQVHSIGSMKRTIFLLPALQNWVLLTTSQVELQCQEESLDLLVLEENFLNIITAKSVEGIQFLHSMIQDRLIQKRPSLEVAVYNRIESLWTSLKKDLQFDTAQILLATTEYFQNIDENSLKPSGGAADLLRKISLSSEILINFLNKLSTSENIFEISPANKRRRTEYGQVATGQRRDSAVIKATLQKLTFVLQLVDDSESAKHPDLLNPLFSILAQLQEFKSVVYSELAYLQCLILGCILDILKVFETKETLVLKDSDVRADLLIDCVQKTSSPQVQNLALLIISSLAHHVPKLILHSVMPIFTFMGSSILQQNDEYSLHVINQTIAGVIPPLIDSLRQNKKNPLTGASELLLSFVAAYEHVPAHRRIGLYISLIQALGPQDFLFALLAMLVEKYGYSISIRDFAIEVFGAFNIEEKLQTAINYIDLISDILKPEPNLSSILLDVNQEMRKNAIQIAQLELSALAGLLSQKQFVLQIKNALSQNDVNAAKVRDIHSMLVENILLFLETVNECKILSNACGDVLEGVLGLLSTHEFLKSVQSLLDRPDKSLRRKILCSLQVRIENEQLSDTNSRVAILEFLPQLRAIIQESSDMQNKYIAINCISKISIKYGKKDLEAIKGAAETISSSYCLGQSDDLLRVSALQCLASIVDILKEDIIFVLPATIPRALEYLKESIQRNEMAQTLHKACFTFMSALLHHLPYMISGAHLDKLLELSNFSAEAILDDETRDIRTNFVSLAVKQIDPKIVFNSLERYWSHAMSLGPLVLREYIEYLRVSIHHHPKNFVSKSPSIFAKIIQNAFDLRRHLNLVHDDRFTKVLIDEFEKSLNQAILEIVYKLNNTIFKPLFIDLVDWATTRLEKEDHVGKNLRQQSLYSFTTIFFDSLKSIVTSYASYILENSINILTTINPKDEVFQELWTRVLRTLTKCFEHDQDDFWQAPNHFKAVTPVLCAQFVNANSLPICQELIPAIVELASVADSPDHHKQLNIFILKHMRSENAYVRLAAVTCEQKLTERLGEEWLSMLPEMLPVISELQEDDDEAVERETHRWILKIEEVLGESLDSMLR